MNELVKKITTYDIFNYLLPGLLLVHLINQYTSYHFLIDENILTTGFLAYFIGLLVSRIGSIVVGPLLKTICIVKFVDYDTYKKFEKKDEKIGMFSEINNMYRSLISAFLVFGAIYLLNLYEVSGTLILPILYFGIIILLILAYRKQTGFITKRCK